MSAESSDVARNSISFELTRPDSKTSFSLPNSPEPLLRTPQLRSALKSPVSVAEGFSLDADSIPLSRTSTINPAPGYRRGVAFDTFVAAEDSRTGGGTGIEFSFTLQSKSEGYQRSRSTREFLCATDLNEYSVNALEWLLDNLLEDGDEVVVLRVIEPPPAGQFLPEAAEIDAKEEAQEVMDNIMSRIADQRSISIIVELCVGKIQDTIQRMISIYKPDSLVVGTRGRADNLWRSVQPFMGSTSRYCLMTSPVPVIVVRPERKVKKSLEQRRTRSSYLNLVNPPTKPGLKRNPASADAAEPSPPSATNQANRSSALVDPLAASLKLLTPWSSKHSKAFKKFKTAPG